jgi:mRNA interferase MazF
MEMVEATKVSRGDVVLVNLDPTVGSEIQKTRPCVVVSPDELNWNLRTYIVAPMTTGGYAYPFRVSCRFKGRSGHIVLDQLRTIDRNRLVRPLGRLPESALVNVLETLQEMFAR